MPPGELIAKMELVERCSARLLRFLYSAAKMNELAWGEAFAGTICHLQDDWCTMGLLQDRHIGPSYRWDDRLTDEKVAELLHDPAHQREWNHAVLAYKGVGCHHS